MEQKSISDDTVKVVELSQGHWTGKMSSDHRQTKLRLQGRAGLQRVSKSTPQEGATAKIDASDTDQSGSLACENGKMEV